MCKVGQIALFFKWVPFWYLISIKENNYVFPEVNDLKYTKQDLILHVTTTFSLKQGETRTSSGPIPHPLRSTSSSRKTKIIEILKKWFVPEMIRITIHWFYDLPWALQNKWPRSWLCNGNPLLVVKDVLMCHKREAVQGSVAKITADEIDISTYLRYTCNMILAVNLYFRVATLPFSHL